MKYSLNLNDQSLMFITSLARTLSSQFKESKDIYSHILELVKLSIKSNTPCVLCFHIQTDSNNIKKICLTLSLSSSQCDFD